MINTIAYKTGSAVIRVSNALGKMAAIFGRTFYWISKGAIDPKNAVSQMIEVGVRSFPVIFLTAFFTGMVLALQTGSSSANIFNEPLYIGTLVGYAMVLELGPVLIAVVVSGRVGAAITAEIGTMRVTEQLDALETLGTTPVKYLAVPRFIGVITMVPVLTLMGDIIGVLGGLIVAVYKWNIPSSVYWNNIFDYMKTDSLYHGLIKSVVFSAIIVTVACYKGFTCRGGAEGVGKATTSAVMVSMISILISDYFLTALLVWLKIG